MTRRVRRNTESVTLTVSTRKTPKAGRSAALGPQHPEIRRQAEETLTHVRELWRDLFRNPFADVEKHGMTGPQVMLIASLVSHGPMSLTDLSRRLGTSHSTASGIVDRLQARGLLERSPDPDDRRRTVIGVTEKVSGYVTKLELGPAGRVASALARGTPAERRAIRDAFGTLRRLLEGTGGGEPAPPGVRKRARP
jgi:MarR family transcriptional regulator, organic hydroperoxide resistance regulator